MTIHRNKYLAFGLTETTVCIVVTFFSMLRNVKLLEAGNTVHGFFFKSIFRFFNLIFELRMTMAVFYMEKSSLENEFKEYWSRNGTKYEYRVAPTAERTPIYFKRSKICFWPKKFS